MPQSVYDQPPAGASHDDEYRPATFPEWEEESLQKIRMNPRGPKPWLDLATIYFFSMKWEKGN